MSRDSLVADLGDVGTGLVEVDVELGAVVGSGEVVEVLERVADAPWRRPSASSHVWNVSPALALLVEAADDAHDRFGRASWPGSFVAFSPNSTSHVAEVAAEQHLVAGRGAAVGAALEPEEADVGDVVLAAAVGAAGDVDAHAAAPRRGRPLRARRRSRRRGRATA